MSRRVLLVFSSSHIGGAERSLTLMARAADERVHFDVATLDGPGPWVDWCHGLGITPLVLGNPGLSNGRGRFSVGTDTPGPLLALGASLHQELALLVAAGLTPREALLAATREPI